jgi:hypothetical protein
VETEENRFVTRRGRKGRHVQTAATDDPRWRPDYSPKTGRPWRRYRGRGRRGRTPGFPAVEDDLDLKHAIGEVVAARELIRVAHEISKWRKVERREAFKVALAKLALASRTLDAVVMRRGGVCGDVSDEESR